MNIEPRLSLTVNGHTITARQIEVLEAIASEGSKAAAARKLRISVPVVHKYIASAEERIGTHLIESTPNGSRVTHDGMEILETARSMDLRFRSERRTTFSCTPVTEELMMSIISSLRMDADLVVSDDNVNMRSLREGMTDMIVLDDPVHLFDLEGFQWVEIGSMDMIHVDKGKAYMMYRYGAQRIAFMHLDAIGTEYTIEGDTMSIKDLMSSGKSFFVDEILLVREGVKIRSATEPRLLRHTINAVYRKDSDDIAAVLNELLKRKN